jgi:RNA polymerase sigma factor (sigma-70 family)
MLHLLPSAQRPLVDRVRAGDVSARGAWFDAEVGRIQGLVFRLVGPRAEVADLVQDIFVQAFGAVGQFEGDERDLGAWLTGVAVNVVHMHLKKLRVRRIMHFFSDVAQEAEELAGPRVDPELRRAALRVWAVLDRFPTDERLVFALRYFNQLELGELAEVLNVSLSTAKRRLSAARARFLDFARRDVVLADWAVRFGHDD